MKKIVLKIVVITVVNPFWWSGTPVKKLHYFQKLRQDRTIFRTTTDPRCHAVADPGGHRDHGPPGPDQLPKIILKMTILDTYLKNFQPRFTRHEFFLNISSCTFCTIIIKSPLNVGTMLQGHVCLKKSFSYQHSCTNKDQCLNISKISQKGTKRMHIQQRKIQELPGP